MFNIDAEVVYPVELLMDPNSKYPLSKEPKMLKLYGNIIANQEKRGFIEKVDVDINTNRTIHYIPHHAVKNDSLTTPIRLVYDCSCRESSGKASLNDWNRLTTKIVSHLGRFHLVQSVEALSRYLLILHICLVGTWR
jgi:hypothetical protein